MTKHTLLYFAGIFDGEGCLNIGLIKKTRFRLQVSITNTNLDLMNWLITNIGGKYYKRKSYSELWKTKYEWRMTEANEMDLLLCSLQPLLVVKKKQIKIAIQFRKSFKVDYWRITPEIRKEREYCLAEMKKLNLKGKIKV